MQKKAGLTQLLFRFWWTALFFTLCYGVYLHGMQKKRLVLKDLKAKTAQLKSELAVASAEREELLLELSSNSDPATRKMLLIKRLGMVPEGQIKVYFEK